MSCDCQWTSEILYSFKNHNFAKSNSGFPKVSQVTPLGGITDFQGAMISKAATGGHGVIIRNLHYISCSC